MIETCDLSEKELKKSATYLKYASMSGICSRCKEHTSVLDSCCGVPIYFEGGDIHPEDAWLEIDTELRVLAIPDFDAEFKDHELQTFGEDD